MRIHISSEDLIKQLCKGVFEKARKAIEKRQAITTLVIKERNHA